MLLQLVLVLGNANTATTAANSTKLGGKDASQYVVNDKFAVLTGTVTASKETSSGTLNFNYPQGFNKDNCVPISYGCVYSSFDWIGFGNVQGAIRTGVRLANNSIMFNVYSDASGWGGSFPCKVVLMKIF